jgi:hypothetical protein
MIEEFVPYELALELKQLGFKETCFGWFADSYLRIGAIVEGKHVQGEGETLAPTYAQAFRWFREKYDLYINITKYNDENDTQDKFYYYISDGYMREEFNTYEEAELECLKKLIQTVKEKK